MAKKAENAKEKNQQVRAAIALALISAPNPFNWDERTISIDTLVEEVRKFLGWGKKLIKDISNALQIVLAEWLPAGWLSYDKQKKCVTVKKNAEQVFNDIAQGILMA